MISEDPFVRAKLRLEQIETRKEQIEKSLDEAHSEGLVYLQGSRQLISLIDSVVSKQANNVSLQTELFQISQLSTDLANRVKTAERVKENVSRTKRFIIQLLGFRENVGLLEKCIKEENWERSATLVAKFRDMEISGVFSIADESLVTASRSLCGLCIKSVRAKFETAISAGISDEVGRLAKLFRPLGIGNEALDKYVSFVCSSLREKALPLLSAASHPFAGAAGGSAIVDSATKLFVLVAETVNSHRQHIEQEFGVRQYERFLQGLFTESESLAIKLIDVLNDRIRKHSKTSQLRETDGLLEEVAIIFQRCNQFEHFMLKTMTNAGNTTKILVALQNLTGIYITTEQEFVLSSIEAAITDDVIELVEDHATSSLVEEVFFVANKSIRRSLSTLDVNAACAVTNHVVSALQGEFKTGLENALNESKKTFSNFAASPKFVHAALQTPHDKFGLEGLITDQNGKLKTKASSSDSYTHALSNTAQSCEYFAALKKESLEAFDEFFPESDKRALFANCVATLDSVKGEANEQHIAACRFALHFFKPAFLSPALADLDNMTFDLSEAAYSDFQVNDPFAKSFISAASVTIDFFKRFLLPQSVQLIIGMLIDQLCAKIERIIFQPKQRFTALGALQLDQDVRRIITHFFQTSDAPVRQKFARLNDICTILNFESFDEFLEFYSPKMRSSGNRLRLDPSEIRQVLLLRIDFSKSKIDSYFA